MIFKNVIVVQKAYGISSKEIWTCYINLVIIGLTATLSFTESWFRGQSINHCVTLRRWSSSYVYADILFDH